MERYRLIHTEQNALLQKGKKSIGATKEEDTSHLKKRRSWAAFTLIAEIARYFNASPLKIETLLKESVEELNAPLAAVNEHNELLYDEGIPALFREMFDISSYEKKEEQEVELLEEALWRNHTRALSAGMEAASHHHGD